MGQVNRRRACAILFCTGASMDEPRSRAQAIVLLSVEGRGRVQRGRGSDERCLCPAHGLG